MKRKKGSSAVTDLRSFLQKSAAKKKQTEPEIVTPSTNENQMQFYPLFTFIEREFFFQAKDQDIISYFQAIKDRKVKL